MLPATTYCGGNPPATLRTHEFVVRGNNCVTPGHAHSRGRYRCPRSASATSATARTADVQPRVLALQRVQRLGERLRAHRVTQVRAQRRHRLVRRTQRRGDVPLGDVRQHERLRGAAPRARAGRPGTGRTASRWPVAPSRARPAAGPRRPAGRSPAHPPSFATRAAAPRRTRPGPAGSGRPRAPCTAAASQRRRLVRPQQRPRRLARRSLGDVLPRRRHVHGQAEQPGRDRAHRRRRSRPADQQQPPRLHPAARTARRPRPRARRASPPRRPARGSRASSTRGSCPTSVPVASGRLGVRSPSRYGSSTSPPAPGSAR